jgi:predicted nucleic acid-binding Zn ribbon protein
MSEKIRLTPLTKTRLPDLDARDAVRFCPKCGRQIPLDRNLCVFCEDESDLPRPSLPKRQKQLVFCLILTVLLLLLLILILFSRTLPPIPEVTPVPTFMPRGTSIPVILLP